MSLGLTGGDFAHRPTEVGGSIGCRRRMQRLAAKSGLESFPNMVSLHSSIGCTQHGHSIGARCTTCNTDVCLL
jgi:hypothetical protein